MGRKLVAMTLMLGLLLLAAGCGAKTEGGGPAKTQANEAPTMTIGTLMGPSSLGIVELMDDGALSGLKTKLEFRVVETPDLMLTKLVSGEIDAAALPTNLAAKLYNKGVGYQLAAVFTWGVNYVVSRDPSVKTVADLKGKKVNVVGRGTTPDFVFRYVLTKNGIDPDKDLTLDYTLQQVELAQSMIAGKATTAVLPEPWVTQVVKASPESKVAVDLQAEYVKAQGSDKALPQTCLVIKKEFADKYPATARSFLDAFAGSVDWVNNHPAEAGKLVENHSLGMKAPVAETAIPRCNMVYKSAKKARPAVESYLNLLLAEAPDSIGGKVPDAGFYYEK